MIELSKAEWELLEKWGRCEKCWHIIALHQLAPVKEVLYCSLDGCECGAEAFWDD